MANRMKSRIELIAFVKDSQGYINYYLFKDNIFKVIWATKPKYFFYFMDDCKHIRWLNEPKLRENIMITNELSVYTENGRAYIESINDVKEIGLGLYKRLERDYAESVKFYKTEFPQKNLKTVLTEIEEYDPKSQGITKKSIGVKRQTADTIINNIIENAKIINCDSSCLYRITLLGVFGSYINSNKEKLGDIDIFYTLKLKDGVTREMVEQVNRKLMTASDRSTCVSENIALGHKTEHLILRRLKNNHVSVSLHDYESVKKMLETEQYKVLFTE